MTVKSMVACAGISSLALLACAASAAETKVETLGDGIWRVRVSRDGEWREGHLNRYGVVSALPVLATGDKMDFGVVSPSVRLAEKGFELRFPLEPGERVYGLGDCNRDCLERRGRIYDIWVANVTSYIPIPFAMTSRGWGVFVNTSRRHTFDVGKTDPGAMVVTAEEGDVDFYVFRGRDYRELLEAYTRVTGRPALLPAFAFGFAYVANQWIDMFELSEEAYRFRSLRLPCDIVGLEPGWMEYFYDYTTKKSWNSSRFGFPSWAGPERHGLTWIGALERMGFKLSLWLCIDYDLFVFEEACAAGLADVKSAMGAQAKAGKESDVFVDEHIMGRFSEKETGSAAAPRLLGRTAEKATSLQRRAVMRPDGLTGAKQDGKEPWFRHLCKFVDRGARCFKLDGGQQVVEHKGRIWAGKYPDAEVHNIYPVVYDKQMAEGYEAYTGRRAMVYSAGGYAGVQRYVATWAGDTGGGKRPLVSVLNLAMSGHPNQSCDMDVFSSERLHFGLFSPWSQQNNWDYFRQPWYQDEDGVDVFRNYVNIRYRLFPYLYGAAAVAARTGWPIMRPLAFAYPDVEEYADEVGTYMLGDFLLVSCFSDNVKIPAGTWYEWRTGARVEGPATLPVEATREWGGALYVKAGSIVPMWPLKQHIDRGWNDVVELHAWPGADGAAELYEDDGDTVAYRTGAFASTRLELRGDRLVVGPRSGNFGGMPKTRRMRAVWHAPDGVAESAEKDVGEDGAEFVR